ncbi:hypothetical protein H0H93_010781, partial [Arthromyces matolae]
MHPRRLFTHVTVAFLLATLVGFQVASAYPVQGDPPSHHQSIPGNNSPRGRPATPISNSDVHRNSSPSGSTASILKSDVRRNSSPSGSSSTGSISESDDHPDPPSSGAVDASSALMTSEFPHRDGSSCLVNKDGLRRQWEGGPTWRRADDATPVKTPPKWLDFEIVQFPGAKRSVSEMITVRNLEDSRKALKAWVSDKDQWLAEVKIRDLQREILYGLHDLTTFDLKDMTDDAKEGYKLVVLRRMLVLLQMYEAPLSWG